VWWGSGLGIQKCAYLAIRAITGVQETAEAVIAVAVGLARRAIVFAVAFVAPVRVLRSRTGVGTGNVDKGGVTFSNSVTIDEFGSGSFVPVGGSGGIITCGRVLGEHRGGSCGSEEEPLEGDHDEG
jgi:hypothetical protein